MNVKSFKAVVYFKGKMNGEFLLSISTRSKLENILVEAAASLGLGAASEREAWFPAVLIHMRQFLFMYNKQARLPVHTEENQCMGQWVESVSIAKVLQQ